ncbi:MAG: DinB family protein, partial [Gemmatimonadota bacterium]
TPRDPCARCTLLVQRFPSFWDADPPEGIEVSDQLFGTLAQVTDKAEVLEHLETAFAYGAEQMASLSDERLETTIQFFGQERSIGAAVFLLLADMHEHLGQAIAYARTNEVVPPWSDGG